MEKVNLVGFADVLDDQISTFCHLIDLADRVLEKLAADELCLKTLSAVLERDARRVIHQMDDAMTLKLGDVKFAQDRLGGILDVMIGPVAATHGG